MSITRPRRLFKGPILSQMAQGFARLAEGVDPLDDR